MHQLSNDYHQCQLIRLDPASESSPFCVLQDAYDPADPLMQKTFFFLQKDGQWVDEIGRSTLEDDDKFQCIFDSVGEVMELFGRLSEKPVIRHVPVTQEQIELHLAHMKSAPIQQRINAMLDRYRVYKSSIPEKP